MSMRLRASIVLALELAGLVIWLAFGGYVEIERGNVYAFVALVGLFVAITASALWMKVTGRRQAS